MKIEIEFNNSYQADLTIDGRKLKYGYKHGVWQFLEGLEDDECESTIGGIVSCKLAGPIIDILQSYMPEEESPDGDCWETWEKLSDSAADEILTAID